MANKPISSPLPANLPTTWIDSQIIAASGASVGLSEQHGYNYLMEQVNTAQSSINTINDAFADLATTEDISGKRVCRFVVGTSTAGWTADDCDYLCDGTADDVEINAAIQALPSTGGEVVILDGTYNITATIAVNKDNVTLSGNGAATVLKRMWNSSSDEGVITVVASSGCCVKEVCVDGNNSSYKRRYNYGCCCSFSTKSIIINNIFINNYHGVYLVNSNEIIISNNTCINNSDSGIYMTANNTKTVLYNIISENNCVENDVGITLRRVIEGLVTCNMVKENMTGISIEVSDNCVVASNIAIRGNGTPSEYSSDQYTIIADKNSANNLIVGNSIMGKNYVDSGTNNTWANNKYQ